MKRSEFITTGFKAGLSLAVATSPLISVGRNRSALSVLYTNDWHSRVDAFPMDGGKYQGLGGASKRAALLKHIRSNNKHTLLLDAGDIWQGTPYFNFFEGEIEYKLMSAMRYDAATLGNHDFDMGLEGLLKQLPLGTFDIVICNYDLSKTILNNRFKPFKVFKKGGSRIGVTGVGIELKNLG